MPSTNGIILSPGYFDRLGAIDLNSPDKRSEDLLVAVLLHEKIYMLEHYVNDDNRSAYGLLQSLGAIEPIPDSFVHSAIEEIRSDFDTIEELSWKLSNEAGRLLTCRYYEQLTGAADLTRYLEPVDQDSLDKVDNSFYHLNRREDRLRGLRRFLRSFIGTGKRFDTEAFEDFATFGGIKSFELFVSAYLDMISYSHDEENDSDQSVELDYRLDGLRADLPSVMGELRADYRKQVQYFATKTPYDVPDRKFPGTEYFSSYVNLLEAKIALESCLSFGLLNRIPIKIPNRIRLKQTQVTEGDLRRPTPQIMSDEHARTYRILLENFNVPRVSDIQALERLQKDRRITEFRKVFGEWVCALMQDEYKAASDLTRYLKRANASLRHLELSARRNWDVYFAVPVGMLDLFLGTPFSLLVGGYSAASRLRSRHLEKKYGWLMIGK